MSAGIVFPPSSGGTSTPSLLAEYIVSGSAVTSIDFSGLDINTHKSYRIEIDIVNATASSIALSMYINNITTPTEYYHQYLYASSTTVSAARLNSAIVFSCTANVIGSSSIDLKLVAGVAKASTIYNSSIPSTSNVNCLNYSKTLTVSNITQLTFVSSVANSIGAGSKIRIYRGDV